MKYSKKLRTFIIIVALNIFLVCIYMQTNNKNQKLEDNNKIDYSSNNIRDDSITIEADSKPQKEIDSNLTDWNLILVNKNNKISDDYNVNLSYIEGSHRVDSRVVTELKNMLYDARKIGLNPIICSSYRTNYTQTNLFNNKTRQYVNYGYNKDNAKDLASYWVAIPGTSEHEIGLAVDIVSKSYQVLNEKQEKTEVQKWLIENSYKYGFVLRYPTDKKDITMINYEPWHYRYVGVENSKYMKKKDMCLEEFIEYLKQFENDNIEV